MAEHRIPRIADRDNEYNKVRRMRMQISPERHDPFALGQYCVIFTYFMSITCMLLKPFLLTHL